MSGGRAAQVRTNGRVTAPQGLQGGGGGGVCLSIESVLLL